MAETVGVEGRGGYYDSSGVLRDMIQNHMFQMLAYLCMEPPASFEADAIRNEKAKLLEAVRVYTPEEVPRERRPRPVRRRARRPTARPRPATARSRTSTRSRAPRRSRRCKLFIDNWRWEGVPIYLRSGKALWKRGTEIVVQFKKAPEVHLPRHAGRRRSAPNRLIFHIQPDQGIELRFQAKTPGPTHAPAERSTCASTTARRSRPSRGTGYEVMLYSCMLGDATLFSRTDLVEAAWRIAQPILDAWAANPPADFPNYAARHRGARRRPST